MILRTPRLILQRFQPKDSIALMHIFADAKVMQYSDGLKDLTWIQQWIQKQQKSYSQQDYGNWAITLANQSECFGYCGLTDQDDVCGVPEITLNYRLAYPYWGKGYASEIAQAVVNYGLDVLKLKRLVATIDPGNLASIRVAQKIGMSYEQEVMYPGYTHPDHVYAIESSH